MNMQKYKINLNKKTHTKTSLNLTKYNLRTDHIVVHTTTQHSIDSPTQQF